MLITTLKNIFTNEPEIDINVRTANDSPPKPAPIPELPGEEVYHIPGNHYTFQDAKALCSAYGGKLADIRQLEDAYENGAEWCLSLIHI